MADKDYGSYHSDLLDKFLSSEDAGDAMRRKAERDIDYYDSKQYTEKEVKELKRRGQPPVTQNLIKQKIDFLLGLERSQRTVPNALPRTPKHEDEAHAATDAIRYVADNNRYNSVRSACWSDLLKAGWAGTEIRIAESEDEGREGEVVVERCPWDRMFWDPYSAERDFSDAAYLGLVVWMDRTEAVRRYGKEAAQVFDETVTAEGMSDTFDDRPKDYTWVQQGKRRRVRVVQMYFIADDGEWDFCEFTRGGILQSGPSPWMSEDGKREHPYSWQSTHVDRDNNRYGIVRELIDLQDEINKRRSKALHHFTVRQTFGNKKSLGDMSARELREQMARPDGHVQLQGETQFGKDFGVIPTNDQAAGHMELLGQAIQTFEVLGPNAAMQGKKEGNESGKAILAQQQGGSIQMGTLTDTLREMDLETYRKIWKRIRQYWTGQTWIRVTDDEANLQFVALNEPMVHAQENPFTGEPMITPAMNDDGTPMMKNKVAELDIDLEIDDAPDMGTMQQEEFENLIELARIGVQFPPKVYLKASNIRNKGDLLRMLKEQDQQSPLQKKAAMLELQGKAAENAKTQAEVQEAQSKTALNVAKARSESMPQGEAGPSLGDLAEAAADIGETKAKTAKTMAEADKITMETSLLPLERLQPAETKASVSV